MSEISNKAGDIRVETLEIIGLQGSSYELAPQFIQEINIYEDIYSPFMFGDILIVDAVNLISRLPIIGTELINLKLRSPVFEDDPSTRIEKCFQLYAVEDRFLNADREQMYSLKFCSQEAYLDQVSTISKSFEGVTSTLAAEIFDEYLSINRLFDTDRKTEMMVADTPHTSKVKYVSNFWTPTQNFNYLGKRSIGKILSGADYLFYESNKNFYYTSVEALTDLGQTRVFDEYLYLPDGISLPRRNDQTIEYYSPELPDEYIRIEDVILPSTMDALNSYQSGMYGASLRSFDFATKKHQEYIYDAIENWHSFSHTEPGNPFPPNLYPNANVRRIWKPFNSLLHGSAGGYGNFATPTTQDVVDMRENYAFDDKFVSRELTRLTYFSTLNQYKFQITIPGRTDIEVGNMIRFVYPAAQVKDGKGGDYDELIDRLLTGNYLITAIHHKIDVGQHKMFLEIVKNGLRADLTTTADGGEPS